jgi:hypothetical protein
MRAWNRFRRGPSRHRARGKLRIGRHAGRSAAGPTFSLRAFERLEDRLLLRAPCLVPGVSLQNGSAPLTVEGGYSTPTVADWNGDGKKDLIVGQYNYGNIWVFLNQGTDSSPVFNGGSKVLCNGAAITTSYG